MLFSLVTYFTIDFVIVTGNGASEDAARLAELKRSIKLLAEVIDADLRLTLIDRLGSLEQRVKTFYERKFFNADLLQSELKGVRLCSY